MEYLLVQLIELCFFVKIGKTHQQDQQLVLLEYQQDQQDQQEQQDTTSIANKCQLEDTTRTTLYGNKRQQD